MLEEVLGSTALYAKECKEIVYHCDGHAMFMDLSGTHTKNVESGKPKIATSLDRVTSSEALRTFRVHCSGDEYYSLPSEEINFANSGAGSSKEQMQLDFYDDSEFDDSDNEVDNSRVQAVVGKKKLFFRVVNKMPSRMKIDSCDDFETGGGSYSNIIVTF